MKTLSIKRVRRLIEEERKSSLVQYFKKFLRTSSAKKHKIEIEEHISKFIADETYPAKKDVLKKLKEWDA